MAVTIQMIETKEFKVKPNGYDPEEVDVFLDSIIDEFEDMQREIHSLRAAAQSKPIVQEPVIQTRSASPEASEAAQKLLSNAQRVSDETLADARRQADLVVADAKLKADEILADARQETDRLQDNLDTMRKAVEDYRGRFKRLLDDQMTLLNASSKDL